MGTKDKKALPLFIDEEQLVTKALEVLIRELGPVEASRFLALPKKRRVESVKRHRQWQAQLKRDDFFDQVFSEQPSKAH